MEEKLDLWNDAPSPVHLQDDYVHVWRANLTVAASHVEELADVLSLDEQARASRYPLMENRRRFIAARAILRTLLAHYVSQPPAELHFSYGPHGKPSLSAETELNSIAFNMSHSGDLALYAVARGRAVGIDVEWQRPRVNFMRIAERFFSIEECEALYALPESARHAAFYRCWTRKEAYVKARGDGIAAGLDTFSVSMDDVACMLRSDEGLGEVARWHLADISLGDEYVGALCAEGAGVSIARFVWSPSEKS